MIIQVLTILGFLIIYLKKIVAFVTFAPIWSYNQAQTLKGSFSKFSFEVALLLIPFFLVHFSWLYLKVSLF